MRSSYGGAGDRPRAGAVVMRHLRPSRRGGLRRPRTVQAEGSLAPPIGRAAGWPWPLREGVAGSLSSRMSLLVPTLLGPMLAQTIEPDRCTTSRWARLSAMVRRYAYYALDFAAVAWLVSERARRRFTVGLVAVATMYSFFVLAQAAAGPSRIILPGLSGNESRAGRWCPWKSEGSWLRGPTSADSI